MIGGTTMTTKTKTISGVAGAAVVAAGITAGVTLTGTDEIDLYYSLHSENNYTQTMTLEIPSNFTADIAELQLNGAEVTKCVLPQGELTTLPIVYTDLSNLQVKFYKLNNYVGEGKFEGDKLVATVSKGVVTKGE